MAYMPAEVEPFLGRHWQQGGGWEHEVHVAIMQRLSQLVDPTVGYGDFLIEELGYQYNNLTYHKQGWPTKRSYVDWKWESIESLLLLLKELDMGD